MTPTETKARHMAIRRAYKQGTTTDTLAKQFKVSRFVIDQAIADIKRSAGRPGNPDRDREIIEKHNAGLGYSKIAKELGLTKQAIHYVLKRHSA